MAEPTLTMAERIKMFGGGKASNTTKPTETKPTGNVAGIQQSVTKPEETKELPKKPAQTTQTETTKPTGNVAGIQQSVTKPEETKELPKKPAQTTQTNTMSVNGDSQVIVTSLMDLFPGKPQPVNDLRTNQLKGPDQPVGHKQQQQKRNSLPPQRKVPNEGTRKETAAHTNEVQIKNVMDLISDIKNAEPSKQSEAQVVHKNSTEQTSKDSKMNTPVKGQHRERKASQDNLRANRNNENHRNREETKFNGQRAAEVSKEDIHKRPYFIQNEILIPAEGESIEYKAYAYPFNEDLKKTLQKTICSFLNQKGGRIYIGVEDRFKKVVGLKLSPKERDTLGIEILKLINDFYPIISHEKLLRVDYIPVQDENNKPIPSLVVVKIIVKQGDQDKIYSVTTRFLQCFMRIDGSCITLNAEQTTSILKKRWSQAAGGEDRVNPKEFNDPVPQHVVDESSDEEQKKMPEKKPKDSGSAQKEGYSPHKGEPDVQNLQNNRMNQNQAALDQPTKKMSDDPQNGPQVHPRGKSAPKRSTFGFKLSGLPDNITLEAVKFIFQNYELASSPNLKMPKTQTDKPHAFINFFDEQMGITVMNQINAGFKIGDHTLKMTQQGKK